MPTAPPPADLERMLTVAEAAAALHLSVSTIYNRLRDGELAGRKVGGVWRIPREVVRRILRPPPPGGD